jgi:hypothetical protein
MELADVSRLAAQLDGVAERSPMAAAVAEPLDVSLRRRSDDVHAVCFCDLNQLGVGHVVSVQRRRRTSGRQPYARLSRPTESVNHSNARRASFLHSGAAADPK